MSFEKVNIAIVDDHSLYLETVKIFLELQDFVKSVEIFTTLQNYLEAKKPFDIVLLDLDLDGESGLDIFKTKHQNKVLIISSYKEMQQINFAYNNGAYGYINKTSDTKEIIRAIKTIVSGNVYYSENIFHKNTISPSVNIDVLSSREIEILKSIVQELSPQEIAKKNFISINTFKVHKYNIIKKLCLKKGISLEEYFKGFF
ncbi:response regulator transcription factor [Candidatus Kapabacteria bacterium]|nr:response regulator transcription factor [Candidatus Kapabacteria bacterium]